MPLLEIILHNLNDALDEKTLQSTKQNRQISIVAGVGAPVAVGAVGDDERRRAAEDYLIKYPICLKVNI